MTRAASRTPVRLALREDSTLESSVEDGLGAVKNTDRGYFDDGIRRDFADSLDLDEATRQGRDQENRWDYLLGHAPSGQVVAVEPHSAKNKEITTVIRKRSAARDQLREHLRDGARVTKWLWVSSGEVHFANTEKARVRLDQNGIEFVGRKIQARHLPKPAESSSAPAEGPRHEKAKSKAKAQNKAKPKNKNEARAKKKVKAKSKAKTNARR